MVLGATGRVGRQIVYDLVAKQVPVRAVVRNHEKAGEVFFELLGGRSSLELVVCDLDSDCTDTLEEAMDGCDSVINATGKKYGFVETKSEETVAMQ